MVNNNMKDNNMKIEDMNNDSMKGKKVEVLDDEGKVIEDGICIGVEDDEVLIYDRGEGFSCEKKNCRVVW
jgi:glycine cleavage system aminomethyltransferase T|tara:strand:+ start:33 stop:242 length:210 start_codon:yes stop_codon:yes gene_type:complete